MRFQVDEQHGDDEIIQTTQQTVLTEHGSMNHNISCLP